MTTIEFGRIAIAIKAAYPNAKIMPDDKSKEVWFTMLSDLDYKICLNAIKEHICTNDFPPSIAEIRDKCADRMHPRIPPFDRAWNDVLRAIGKFGYPDPEGAYASMNELTASIVRNLGWKNICMSENIQADRANFRMAYEARTKEIRIQNQLPNFVCFEKENLLREESGIKLNEEKRMARKLKGREKGHE